MRFETSPRDGELENGDGAVVREVGGVRLLAVIDALGHGTRAAAATEIARRVLEAADPKRGVEPIFDTLGAELAGTRGACALVMLAHGEELELASVGNVELRATFRVPLVLTPGVLGGRVRSLKVCRARAVAGGRACVYTDGISSRFQLTAFSEASTEEACRAIFAKQRRAHDDATLLVADFSAPEVSQ